MRLHVISDVHDRTDEALRRCADGADALICLGDLLLYLDYTDPSAGILGELFGPVDTGTYIDLRSRNRFGEASDFAGELWRRAGLDRDSDRAGLMEEAIHQQYERIFDALPAPAYLTYGNVDVPAAWPQHVRAGHRVVDREIVEIGGLRFGFVGGGLRSPMRTPYEVDPAEYSAALASLGPVDILCTHIPPSVVGLTYDVVARRFEVGSDAIVDYITEHQPRLALFGHVHQPLAQRHRLGRTECVNVGHFRATGAPYVIRW